MKRIMHVNETFRLSLKRAREDKGLDAKSLSLKAGLGERAVKDIEEGRSQSPKISTVFALASVLGEDPAEMLGLGPRPDLLRELVLFLEQYGQSDQERILAALRALPLSQT